MMSDQDKVDEASDSQPATQQGTQPHTLASEDLLQGRQEVFIRHGQEVYRLRVTRNGKLILHK